MAPVADDPAPPTVRYHVCLSRKEQLSVATHPFVQRVDHMAAIDLCHHRHSRIERNLLPEPRLHGLWRGWCWSRGRCWLKGASQEPVIFGAGRRSAANEQIVVRACGRKTAKCRRSGCATVHSIDNQNSVACCLP